MKRLIALFAPLAMLAGCAVVPYGSPYYGAPYYAAAPAYGPASGAAAIYAPAPLYAPAPVYVAPPVSLDFDFRFFRGGHGHRHHR
jgi:hypothetical protein